MFSFTGEVSMSVNRSIIFASRSVQLDTIPSTWKETQVYTHKKSQDTSDINFILFKKKKTLNMIHVSPYGDIKVSEFIKFSIKIFKAFYDLISPNIWIKIKAKHTVFQALIDNNGFKWWWKRIDTIVALGDNHKYRNFCSVTQYSFLTHIISCLKANTETISMCQHNTRKIYVMMIMA